MKTLRIDFFSLFVFTAFCFFPLFSISQEIFYQNHLKGEVVCLGYSPGASGGTFAGAYEIPSIASGSILQKAILLVGRVGQAPNMSFLLNSDLLELNSTNQVSSTFDIPNYGGPSAIHAFDVTTSIGINSIVEISSDFNQNLSSNKYTDFILFLVYENTSLSTTGITIYLNTLDFGEINLAYTIDNLPLIENNTDVGFSICSSYVCDTIQDGELVFVNSTFLGVIGGDEENAGLCGGPIGCFLYSSNTLFGLCDDIANENVSGTDALANIQAFMPDNSNSLNIDFEYQSPSWPLGVGTNIIWGFTLAYTTPCQPFETTLTEEVAICRGDSTQLLATGGSASLPVAYEWLPQEDLSCYDCPNPVFVGDSTRHYTVRIWSTDSCSKVLPVKVLVYDVPTQASLNLNPATCSESNGSLSISNVVGGTPQYVYNIGGNSSTNPNFNNLAPGVYNLQITDANICTYNQPFTIEEINPVTAAFTANPQQGVAPLNVNFTNQSTGANLYQWLVNTQTFESFNLNYTFDTAATYPVQLIASYNEPHCADTALKV
jgi:hypothetical protein